MLFAVLSNKFFCFLFTRTVSKAIFLFNVKRHPTTVDFGIFDDPNLVLKIAIETSVLKTVSNVSIDFTTVVNLMFFNVFFLIQWFLF